MIDYMNLTALKLLSHLHSFWYTPRTTNSQPTPLSGGPRVHHDEIIVTMRWCHHKKLNYEHLQLIASNYFQSKIKLQTGACGFCSTNEFMKNWTGRQRKTFSHPVSLLGKSSITFHIRSYDLWSKICLADLMIFLFFIEIHFYILSIKQKRWTNNWNLLENLKRE